MPLPTIDEAIELFRAVYEANGPVTLTRADGGSGVVVRLRGNFEVLGNFAPGSFDAGQVLAGVEAFWRNPAQDLEWQWNLLFDPSSLPSRALVRPFVFSSISGKQAVARAQQYQILADRSEVVIAGAVVSFRIAAVPDGCGRFDWRLDGVDSQLEPQPDTPQFGATSFATGEEVARKACGIVFGRETLIFDPPSRQYRAFSSSGAPVLCWKIPVAAQRGLRGRTWGRGAVIYWPDDALALRPLHVEPDGRYAQALPNNNGVYQKNLTLMVAPAAGGRYRLVDDSLKPAGPAIETGRLVEAPGGGTVFQPLETGAGGWQHDPAKPPNLNPGVGADVHAAARDTARYFLDLCDRLDIAETVGVLPDPVKVAVYASPAAQPGEWRTLSKTAVIANPDWNLPPSWLRRWQYCCATDVVAHELSHAMLNQRCCFEYSLESGALEEALADLFTVFATGNDDIFEQPWAREMTTHCPVVDWLRSAAWRGPMSAAPISPNDRVERGEYPNHYAQFARLAATIDKAALRSKPRNDHGYIHWNCAMLTRALAMLARTKDDEIVNPESGLKALALGREAVSELVFAAIQALNGELYKNIRDAETPFAKFRSSLLDMAASSQFDEAGERRLVAAQVMNVLNATGIGPILSVRGRPAGVRAGLMPQVAAGATVTFRQGANQSSWTPGDVVPIAVARGADLAIAARVANLGIGTDRARPALSVLVEKTRGGDGIPDTFVTKSMAYAPQDLAPGQAVTLGPLTIPAAEMPGFDDPWIGVFANDRWNQLRSAKSLRAAIAAPGQPLLLPLNAALIRLRLT